MQGSLFQVTTGNSAKPQYSICKNRVQPCSFDFAENTHWAWTQVHVTNTTLQLWSRGVQDDMDDITSLYVLTISRVPFIDPPTRNLLLFDTIYSALAIAVIILIGAVCVKVKY